MTAAIITPVQTGADLAAAAQLFRDYAASLNFSLCFQDFDRELAELPGAYAPPRGTILLARAETVPVGVVALRPLAPDICEMKRLYLAPESRGGGLGRRLVLGIIEAGRQRGYRAMRLDTVQSSMAAAIGLYRDLGFREIPAYTHNPQPDVLYLELPLV